MESTLKLSMNHENQSRNNGSSANANFYQQFSQNGVLQTEGSLFIRIVVISIYNRFVSGMSTLPSIGSNSGAMLGLAQGLHGNNGLSGNKIIFMAC